MAVGAQPNQGNINQTLTQFAVTLRDGATNILYQWAYLNDLGLAGLEVIGFTAEDAQSVLNMINYMATLAQVYRGTAAQPAEFDFESALTPLWGGS